MIFQFIDTKTLVVIFHLVGLAIGAGGAYASDILFIKSVNDEKISATELSFLKLLSKMVWVGLAILILSGLVLFFMNPSQYLQSSKFLAKMFIVLVIVLNGIIFHFAHIPLLNRHKNMHFPSSQEFFRYRKYILISGTISMVSWTSALVLGAIKSIPYSATSIIFFYIIIILFAISIAILGRNKILRHDEGKPTS